ncbi:bifunctional riboflavin kinase/FAD synthetase [Bacilliculturomica massiliensis]|uniref:bifunctional riboflavin kinase/FAD synthetase n=1 Tax=Bacilliculturomica massiliensis TaxID=1917867 RepID=UPI001030E505|nr:bifunctional riboflavin kinase/FAD synthetase [Bacilliculturomica massiliensis]
MKVFRSLSEIENIDPTSVALGNFDGIHRGHQELIRHAGSCAREKGLKSAVFTFTNHPKNVLSGKSLIKNILYPDEKAAILELLGVDYLFSLDFTEEIMTLPPIDFLEKLLIGRFRMKEAFCGFNFHFGYKAEGNPEFLRANARRLGYGLTVLAPFTIDGNVVSSTLIRNLIAVGEVEACPKYLGRYYSIGGRVVVGNKIGRTIGFPTLNCTIDETMVSPSNGVYITYCMYDGIRYESVTNVGNKPTIGKYKKNIETHIFDFDEEIYGEEIRVEFVKKIRDEYKFDSVDALSVQIGKDCNTAREFHQQRRENIKKALQNCMEYGNINR